MAGHGLCSSQTQLPLCPFIEAPGETEGKKKSLFFHLSFGLMLFFMGLARSLMLEWGGLRAMKTVGHVLMSDAGLILY